MLQLLLATVLWDTWNHPEVKTHLTLCTAIAHLCFLALEPGTSPKFWVRFLHPLSFFGANAVVSALPLRTSTASLLTDWPFVCHTTF